MVVLQRIDRATVWGILYAILALPLVAQGQEASPLNTTDNETAWMVTAIIFIVLFAVSIIVCIYLWCLRNAKVKELRHVQDLRAGKKGGQNVWYGGSHI